MWYAEGKPLNYASSMKPQCGKLWVNNAEEHPEEEWDVSATTVQIRKANSKLAAIRNFH